MVCARLEFVWRGTGLGAQVYGRACVPGHWQLLDRGQGGIGAQVWWRWGLRSGVRWVRGYGEACGVWGGALGSLRSRVGCAWGVLFGLCIDWECGEG